MQSIKYKIIFSDEFISDGSPFLNKYFSIYLNFALILNAKIDTFKLFIII